MRNKNNKYIVYLILGVVILGVAYTACKDITLEQQRIETSVELKLSK